MTPAEFWDSTVYEVELRVRAHAKRKREAWERTAQLAAWIANNVSAFGRKRALRVSDLIRMPDEEVEVPVFTSREELAAWHREQKRKWLAQEFGVDPDEITDEDIDNFPYDTD